MTTTRHYLLNRGTGAPDVPCCEPETAPFSLAYRTVESAIAAARAWLESLPADHCGYSHLPCSAAGCACYSTPCHSGLVLERRVVPGTDVVTDEIDAVHMHRAIEWRAIRREQRARTVVVESETYTRTETVETVVQDWTRQGRHGEVWGATWVGIREVCVRWAPGEEPTP